MSKLDVTLACGLYDRTRGLFDGTVKPEGVNLNFSPYGAGRNLLANVE